MTQGYTTRIFVTQISVKTEDFTVKRTKREKKEACTIKPQPLSFKNKQAT